MEIPPWIEVPKPADPNKFVKDFIAVPKTHLSQLSYLVAALGGIPQRERDQRWPEKLAKAIGGAAATEEELEYALVYLAPALGMAPLAFLAECAKTAATKFKLEDLPYHLMSYVHLAVKYAYADNQPPETQAPAIMLVLHALNLTLASIKDSEKQRIRRLRMLTIIHNNYTKWPDANLRDLWTWYQQTYFPASQYPLMPHL